MNVKVVKAAGMIDVRQGVYVENPQLLIRGKTIESVGRAGDPYPEPCEVVDLGELTILPGLIDAHMHFFGIDTSKSMFERYFLESDVYKALFSVRDASNLLKAGFTSVRCLGSFIDIVLARAINDGLIPGPRIVPAGQFIMQRGGTWDNLGLPEAWIEGLDMFADGEEECRRIVRRRIRAGAGVIKIGLSSGHLGSIDTVWGDDPSNLRLNFSLKEVQAMVEVTHNAGLKVSAHSIGEAAVNLAIDGGVDIIEHGHGISDDTRRRLRDTGKTVVSTLSCMHFLLTNGPSYGITTPEVLKVAQGHFDEQVRSMQRSLELGVQYAIGSDMIGPPCWPHGENATEYELVVQAVGANPVDVLRDGLLQGASVLGLEDQIGSLEATKLADIVAVEGDPLRDISVLKRVRFVMKEGEVVRHDATAT